MSKKQKITVSRHIAEHRTRALADSLQHRIRVVAEGTEKLSALTTPPNSKKPLTRFDWSLEG